jgi:hypothetical protein
LIVKKIIGFRNWYSNQFPGLNTQPQLLRKLQLAILANFAIDLHVIGHSQYRVGKPSRTIPKSAVKEKTSKEK